MFICSCGTNDTKFTAWHYTSFISARQTKIRRPERKGKEQKVPNIHGRNHLLRPPINLQIHPSANSTSATQKGDAQIWEKQVSGLRSASAQYLVVFGFPPWEAVQPCGPAASGGLKDVCVASANLWRWRENAGVWGRGWFEAPKLTPDVYERIVSNQLNGGHTHTHTRVGTIWWRVEE